MAKGVTAAAAAFPVEMVAVEALVAMVAVEKEAARSVAKNESPGMPIAPHGSPKARPPMCALTASNLRWPPHSQTLCIVNGRSTLQHTPRCLRC